MLRAAPANAAAPPARRKNSRLPNFIRSSLPLIRQGEALPSSIHFGAGKLHDPSPLFGFNGDEAFELRGRHRLGVAAKLFDARLELRIGKPRGDIRAELVDNEARRGSRRTEPSPRAGSGT